MKNTNKSVLVDDYYTDAIFSTGFAFLRAKQEIIPKFLFYLVANEIFQNKKDTIAVDGIMGGIRQSDILNTQIPLPPLEVQKAIVAEIDDYQKIIDGARQVVENYKPTIKIDPDWPMVALDEVCESFNNGVNFSKEQVDKGTKFVNIKDLFSDGYVNISNLGRVQLTDREILKKSVKDNDLLFVRSSVKYEGVGFPSLVRTGGEQIVFCGFIIKCSPVSDKIIPYYLLSLLRTDEYRNKVVALSNKANITNISQDSLKSLQVPLPPLTVQNKIVARIEVEQQIVNANKKLIEMYEQKIKAKIAEVWGCGTSQATVRATTPYKNDAAVVCLLLFEMEKLQRPTTEFFIQKHMFATKHHLHLPVNSVFKRKVAGPWSQELRWKAIEAAIKMNWLRWEKNRLVPGFVFGKGLSHASTVLGESTAQITQLVEDLKGFGSNGLERWTTVLKVVEDLKEQGQPITRDNIQREINTWPGKSLKEIFAEESVDHTIKMMLKHNWLPTSAGQ